jgi:DNA-directed RNA polymerase specialized sigma24 family protein
MAESDSFPELIRAVRAGDEDAAARLMREFEPFILRVARFQMRHRRDHDRLRPRVGYSDICQSVFKSLFDGLKKGRFQLEQPEQLEKLLSAMSRLKIATEARKLSVILREVLYVDAPQNRVDPAPGPEKPVEDRDLSEAIIKQFSADELDLLMRRLDDQPWSEIAAALGSQVDAVRKKLARAVARVRNDPALQSSFEQ